MAIISMRELLRTPGDALARIDEGEPCLVTRHGKPIAALVPVDQSQVESFILASAPEFVEARRDAEHARAEGRTISLEEAAQQLGIDLGDEASLEVQESVADAHSAEH